LGEKRTTFLLRNVGKKKKNKTTKNQKNARNKVGPDLEL
jgi:hypothetical protein